MRRLVSLGLVLLAGCSPDSTPVPASGVGTAPATHAPLVPARAAATISGTSLPAGACRPEGYETFFEAFVTRDAERRSLSAPGVDTREFHVEMRDSTWVDPATPDVPLDIGEARDGDTFTAEAVPVERDENDEIVRRLGPPVRYRFRHVDGCWQYVGRD